MRASASKIIIFLACLVCPLCFSPYRDLAPAFAADASAWTWDVLVIPPDSGWESEAGLSVRRALEWNQEEISEHGSGVNGRDLNFVLLPPTDEDSARDYSLPPLTDRVVAVFSFASYPVDRYLAERFLRSEVPLILGGGENVSFQAQGSIPPPVFALDLFRDYRCRAFAELAVKTMPLKARLGIMGTRFTLNEEREAQICFDLFSKAGFMPMPYWTDASVSDTFSMVEQEIKSYSDGALLSYIGGMATKEIWRGIMRNQSRYRIWYGGVPEKSFLSFTGIWFADQNFYLDERGGFETLKRHMWSTRTIAVPDKVAAGRANAAAFWLIAALQALRGEFNREALLSSLESVRGIPFGGQVLDIDEVTHRPRQRQVYILEVRDRSYLWTDTITVEGLRDYGH